MSSGLGQPRGGRHICSGLWAGPAESVDTDALSGRWTLRPARDQWSARHSTRDGRGHGHLPGPACRAPSLGRAGHPPPPSPPAAPVSTAHTSHGHSSQGRRERAGPPRLHWLRGAPPGAPPPAPRPLPLVFRGSVLSAQTHPHEHDKRDAGGTRADPSERGRTRDHGQDTEAAGAPHTALGAELPTRRLNKLPRGGHR